MAAKFCEIIIVADYNKYELLCVQFYQTVWLIYSLALYGPDFLLVANNDISMYMTVYLKSYCSESQPRFIPAGHINIPS